jgi:hypothetical protein
MGLLDDAIREHLELKRQHGANPEEVARQEREALGPARAAAEPAAEPAEPAETPDETAAVAASDELPAGEPGIAEEPSPGHEAGAPGYDEDPWLEEEPAPPPAESPPPAEDAGAEDVLEETPEFLQETPEHDRLWFEQKPPRDFDWDG